MTIFLCLGSPKKKTRTSYVTEFDDDEDIVTGEIYMYTVYDYDKDRD